MTGPVNICWLRRDLRLFDHAALATASRSTNTVLPLFIFDTTILDQLEENDARVTFIHAQIGKLQQELRTHGSDLLVMHGKPDDIFRKLIREYEVSIVFAAEDYEPAALERDQLVSGLLAEKDIAFRLVTDHVIFCPGEVLKDDGTPYSVYTPFMKRWRKRLIDEPGRLDERVVRLDRLAQLTLDDVQTLEEIGFRKSEIEVPDADLSDSLVRNYKQDRDRPDRNGTTLLGPHLRFGTLSIRQLVRELDEVSPVLVNELIWREFFIHVMAHHPYAMTGSFRKQYDAIHWRNDESDFDRWCNGKTGYPIVDAGMRELNATGHMHNRVRMITASFLVKHLLIDWRWGELYFQQRLLDFELASNNGNWQWVAGTGCDAAPYFRVFNPTTQQQKFDPDLIYVKKWVPEFGTPDYPEPMVDHKMARERALTAYGAARN